MSINDTIRDLLMPETEGVRVEDVRIGLGYTAVRLEDGGTGVALTFLPEAKKGCTVFSGLDPLAGKEAPELLAFLTSRDPVEAAVGLATANAVVNRRRQEMFEGDILDSLTLYPDDHVGMVGFFAPVLPRLKKITASVSVFERIPQKQGDLIPAREAYRLLPRCQVALITSTTLLNHTVDGLLEAATACREVILLGASTPLIPHGFAGTPVTGLSGVIVNRPLDILRIVSEGRGMRYFKGSIKKVNIRLQDARPAGA